MSHVARYHLCILIRISSALFSGSKHIVGAVLLLFSLSFIYLFDATYAWEYPYIVGDVSSIPISYNDIE